MCVIHSFASFVPSFIHLLRHSFIPPSLSLSAGPVVVARAAPSAFAKSGPRFVAFPLPRTVSGCDGADTPPRPPGQAPGYPCGPWRRRGTPEQSPVCLLGCPVPAEPPPPLRPRSQSEQRGAAGTALRPGKVRARDPRPRPSWHGAGLRRGERGAAEPPGPGLTLEGNVKNLQAHCSRLGRRRRNAQSDHQHAWSCTIRHLIHFCNLNFGGPPPFKPICDIGVFSLHSSPPLSFEMHPLTTLPLPFF